MRTSSSCSHSVSTADNALTMVWVSELIALGRLSVITPDALVDAGEDLVGLDRQAWLLRGSGGNYYDILVLGVDIL